MILLIASFSQSSGAIIIKSTIFLGGGGGGGLFRCTARSRSLFWNVSDCGRGIEGVVGGDETSGFEGPAGDGAELESFASRFARTYKKRIRKQYTWVLYGILIVWGRHPLYAPWLLRGRWLFRLEVEAPADLLPVQIYMYVKGMIWDWRKVVERRWEARTRERYWV